MLADAGAVKTDLEDDPRQKNKIRDIISSSLWQGNQRKRTSDSDDEDD